MAHSKVEARWMTVSSVVIDDGKSRILFDPAWTRPGLSHWLGISSFKSDEKLVSEILNKNGLAKIDAVFASHSHFDHVMDAPMVSKLTGAIFYTDESSERIANAYHDPKIRTIPVESGKEIRIGDFLITVLGREHSKIFQKIDFLPGAVPADTNLNFWDYHVGNSWFYLIKHPEGTILLDQGCESHVDDALKVSANVDVLLQGWASRKDDESILDGYVKTYKPKIYVPLHFDNFFADFKEGDEGDLPFIKFDQMLSKLKKAYPTMKVDRPLYGRPITLLEIK
jgi:L-ascorbate metabolism protein UlaG (beta-lactamase superfamily)